MPEKFRRNAIFSSFFSMVGASYINFRDFGLFGDFSTWGKRFFFTGARNGRKSSAEKKVSQIWAQIRGVWVVFHVF